MKRQDARILFNKNDMDEITDLIVAEFNDSHYDLSLYKKYSNDLNLRDYNELGDILLRLNRYVISKKIYKGVLYELGKIDEWRESIGQYGFSNCYESELFYKKFLEDEEEALPEK